MQPTIDLILPPFTQLNTPYPSISYLARWLHQQHIPHSQRDLGIELALRIYSRAGLSKVFDWVEDNVEEPAGMGVPSSAAVKADPDEVEIERECCAPKQQHQRT